MTRLAYPAPPASLLSPKCSKAGETELLAVWPIAWTKYFLFLAVFHGNDETSVLSVGRIVIPGKADDAPYDPPAAVVARARAILASCHRVQVLVEPQGNWHPPIGTWTFSDRAGKRFQLTDVEVVFSDLFTPDRSTIRKCVERLARGKKCPDDDHGFSIGTGARVIHKSVAVPADWVVLDQEWVGTDGSLFVPVRGGD